MEGRWTIMRDSEKNGTWLALGPGLRANDCIPVVPCDDAAIERAAAVLEHWYGPSPHRLHIAAAVLRAAGETP